MKKAKWILSFVLLLGMQKVSAQKSALKEEAKAFSLEVVKTYFTGDCDALFNAFSPFVFALEDDGLMEVAGLKDKLCKSLSKAVREKSRTFEDYLADYEVSLKPVIKYKKKLRDWPVEGYEYLKGDLLFEGARMKNPGSNSWMWDDMLVFVVRKVDGRWKIIGVSG